MAGRRHTNENFCAAILLEQGQEARGHRLYRGPCRWRQRRLHGLRSGANHRDQSGAHYYGTPDIWDTTVALDRIIGAQNACLTGVNRCRHPVLGLTTLTTVVFRGLSWLTFFVLPILTTVLMTRLSVLNPRWKKLNDVRNIAEHFGQHGRLAAYRRFPPSRLAQPPVIFTISLKMLNR